VTAFIFDLDGTLVDSVYQHVSAWQKVFSEAGFHVPVWKLHRRIGMTGDLMIKTLASEYDWRLDEPTSARMELRHAEEMRRLMETVRPLEGAQALLRTLSDARVDYAIATSGDLKDVRPLLDMLQLDKNVPVISKEDTSATKPDPQPLLVAAKRLKKSSEQTMVVGDSVWDMLAARRAHFLGIGFLTGGYGAEELAQAGAYRVYADPAEMRKRLYETGVHISDGKR